jgi:hypothetical protein
MRSRFLGRRMEKHFSTQQSARYRAVILACGKRRVRFAAFLGVGAEWFLMLQSKSWNGQESAFRDFAVIGIVLPLVAEPDADGQPSSSTLVGASRLRALVESEPKHAGDQVSHKDVRQFAVRALGHGI